MRRLLVFMMTLILSACGKASLPNSDCIASPQLLTAPIQRSSCQAPQQFHAGALKFLVVGQSNSVGPANGAAPTWSTSGNVSINDYYHDAAALWTVPGKVPLTGADPQSRIRVPTAADPNDSGYTWIKLGDLLPVQTTFYVVGRGGTSTRQWVSGLHQRIVDALSTGTYDAVIWVQGESDEGLCISKEESAANLKSLIDESRTIQPGIRWFVSLDEVEQAQGDLIGNCEAEQGVNMDTLRLDRANFDSLGVELSSAGFDAAAQAWADILLPLIPH